jgi:transglutaminase-like putative cysteine protease
MKKIVSFLIILILSALAVVKLSLAVSKEFRTEYQVTIEFNGEGKATVQNNISLTNNFANIYPKEYYLETGIDIKNVTAWDKEGNILKSVESQDKKTKIKLLFNKPRVGKKKKTSFTVKYSTSEFSERKGSIWEIHIPAMENMEQIDDYSLKIIIPSSFGNLSYASVKPKETTILQNQTTMSFTGEQLTGRPLVLAFGNSQFFDFTLSYYLKNNFQEAKIFQIAIPPNTASQDVYYQSINPRPQSAQKDQNGNWLLEYLLAPREKKEIMVKGKVKILPRPRKDHYYNNPNDVYLFLKETKYWDISNPEIRRLAQKLKTPRAIYQYVVDSLDYNFNRVTQSALRKGASIALRSPQDSVCTEFTDLFIAIARAAGIPAREIQGYAYTTNTKLRPLSLKTDILHAWPEYWDKNKKMWIQVDPTWGKTTGGVDYFNTFDLNHFAFVIHGTNSELPAPAGSYPDPNNRQKTVKVSFSRQTAEDILSRVNPEEAISLQVVSSDPREKKTKIEIRNNTLFPLENVNIEYQGVKTRFFRKKLSATTKITVLPPYGNQELTAPQFALSSLFFPVDHLFEVSFETYQKTYSNVFSVKQASYFPPVPLLLIIGTSLLMFFLGIFWQIRRKKLKRLEKTA